MLETLLWVGQGLLAVVFTVTGAIKTIVPRERLVPHMRWAKSWPRGRIKLLGFAELAGAVGLVVPRATGLMPMLTPIAAVCLAMLMAGATQTHRRLGESVLPPAVIGMCCIALAGGLFAAGAHT